MSEHDPAPDGFTVIFNPSSGDPWNCPTDALDYWTGEKGWRKTAPNKQAAAAAKEMS